MQNTSSNAANVILAETIGEAWRAYCGHVLKNGRSQPDDREDIIEASPVMLEITKPSSTDAFVHQHGDPHVIDIYTKKMYSMEIIAELNSTYGDRIFANAGVNQFNWMISRLKLKWWTKAAAVSLLKPNDPGPRIPCLTQVQFVQRDQKLNLHCVFRSQNVFRSYGNFLGLKSLLDKASSDLGVPSGCLIIFVSCPHIYSSDMEAAQRIAEL